MKFQGTFYTKQHGTAGETMFPLLSKCKLKHTLYKVRDYGCRYFLGDFCNPKGKCLKTREAKLK